MSERDACAQSACDPEPPQPASWCHPEPPQPRGWRVGGAAEDGEGSPATSARPGRWTVVLATTAIALIAIFPIVVTAQTTRIASDFELKQMQQQVANSRDFASQVSAHLNLGDLRSARGETALATAEYRQAAAVAERARTAARTAGDPSRYAMATSYAGLCAAELGNAADAFELLEESLRVGSGDAKSWNIYAIAMNLLNHPRKAVSASRNALAIGEAKLADSPSTARRLDVAIYRYSLATALLKAGEHDEGQRTLETVVASLRDKDFDPLRKAVARAEAFEIYSSVSAEPSAYLSLQNFAQLRLARLYEQEGDVVRARKVYQDVLAGRSDDATALAALARLSTSPADRARGYAEAFDANPFSMDLIREYETWLKTAGRVTNDGTTTGAMMRRALEQRAAGENVTARETLDAIAAKFPENDVVRFLSAENDLDSGDIARARSRSIRDAELRRRIQQRIDSTAAAQAPAFLSGTTASVAPTASELRQLIGLFEQQLITPDQRLTLDKLTFTSTAVFDPVAAEPQGAPAAQAETIFETGSIDGIPFRFSEPMKFAGTFTPRTPLSLNYRVLGISELNGATALLIEPLRLAGMP